MQQLFPTKNTAEGIYFLEKEKVYIRFGGSETHEIDVENVLVGSLDYFLKTSQTEASTGLLEVYVRSKSKLKIIPQKTADRMMKEYRFGFNSNIFLARLLELTNNYYSKTSRQVPKNLWQYKLRAEQFTKLSNAVLKYGELHAVRGLVELAKANMNEPLYKDGKVLSRELILKSISTPSKPLSEFVIRYKQNASICREGGKADAMYVLLKGRVAVVTYGRRAATIENLGEAFGEAGLFLDGKRTATLIAETDADLYVIHRNELPKFFATHRGVFANIAATLAKRIRDNIKNADTFRTKLKELKERTEQDEGGLKLLEEESRAAMEEFRHSLITLERKERSIPSFAQFLDLIDTKS